MTNLLIVGAVIVFAIIFGIMLPKIARVRKLDDLTPASLSALAKIIFPLMALFVLLILLAGLSQKDW
ncbi:hypothetical protein SAMN02927900_06490 [Rhizobium mongolense subsp. loessense]|uniref:Uncharacterized protein n=1 Tax=Rhizobium mongolense subsp. loessense TaxID=158890 RepID=A0A1G4UDE1_9HYPH|nr:hypothetical protein [Rhizobium mongolense]SCW90759.1 hypothetical protein SAMN02927900_06490 [Rhizobium mongolense subsp. loessense]